jgi:hypothetical protein
VFGCEKCQHSKCGEKKYKEFTKESNLVLYHVVGYALIVDFSIKTIRQ